MTKKRIGYIFYYQDYILLAIKDEATGEILARKEIPMQVQKYPFEPPDGAEQWFKENGGVDIVHFH
ncbi:MAG: hypothetical protein FK734_17320 [Asgard group archaeon]|nr:hypothetical protein [Asgard group archaeon]